MGIMNSVLRIFTWWDGSTLGTQLWSWRKGVKVGEDTAGNRYFKTKDDSKRWVMFNGPVEASSIDAEWHGWLHRTFDEPPTERPMVHKSWERAHQDNQTGTDQAYAPAGSLRHSAPQTRADYEAWTPE